MNAYSGPFLAVTSERGASAAIDDVAGDPSHSFLRAAWFGGAERTLVVRRGGRPVAALPLVKRRPLLSEVPGSYWPFRSFPVAEDVRGDEMAALLRAAPAVWRMGPVREDDPTLLRLAAAAREAGVAMLRRALGTTYVLDLAGREGWPSGSTLKKNRWFEKKLAEDGALRFETVYGGDGALYDALAEVERNSWIARDTDAKDAKFLAPHHRACWERAAADPAIAVRMRVTLMRIGERPAAFVFALEAGETLSIVANSYDERFARHSPGRVLIYRELQRAVEAGFTEVDWGAGDPGYKSAIGAVPGAEIVDCLFVRSRVVAAALRRVWER